MIREMLVKQWLKRAISNLRRAEQRRKSTEILFEDLCYDCQQSVEKSLKALIIHNEMEIVFTHSISRLLEIIASKGIEIPEDIQRAVILTDYAVNTRYPGDYDEVEESEFEEALAIAKNVLGWVQNHIVNIS